MDREELIRLMTEAEANETAVLMQSVENAKAAALAGSTKANLGALELAQKLLTQHLGKVRERGTTFPGLKTGLAVLDYLKAQNRKIAKSKLYQDLKGIPKRDGGWPRAAIDRYAASLPWASAPAAEQARGEDLSALGLEKARLEVDKLREDHRRLSMQNDKLAGKLVDRREAELDRADALLALYSSFLQAVEENARVLVEAAGGDPEKTPDLAERLKALLDDTCNRLGRAGTVDLDASTVLDPCESPEAPA